MIEQIQEKEITGTMKEENNLQMSMEFSSTSQIRALKEQTQRMDIMEAKIDKLLEQNGEICLSKYGNNSENLLLTTVIIT